MIVPTEIDEAINLIEKTVLNLKKLYRKDILVEIKDLNGYLLIPINMFLQIYLRRITELLESIKLNAQYKNKLPIILCARGVLETVATLCAFKDKFDLKIRDNKLNEIHQLIHESIRKTRDPEYLSIFESDEDKKLYRSTNTLTDVQKLFKIDPEAVKDYEYLSNQSHPNYEGLFALYAFYYEYNNLVEFDSPLIEDRNKDEILKTIEIAAKYGVIFCKLHDGLLTQTASITQRLLNEVATLPQ